MEEGIKLPAEGATMQCKASGRVLQSLSLLGMTGFCWLAGLGGCVCVCVCVCVSVVKKSHNCILTPGNIKYINNSLEGGK